jgi:hypothetical protein
VGAVRHRELIRVLSLVVVLNMAVGVVAVAVRSGDRAGRETTQFAGSVGIPLDTENGGILAGGNFSSRRRGPSGSSTTDATAAPATSATTAPAATSTSAAAPSTTGRPAAATSSTARPGTTATTRGSPGGSTAATRPAPAITATTTRPTPGSTAAPAVTTSSGPNGVVRNGGKLGDPKGDTFIDGTQDPIKEARADIIRARAVYQPGAIALGMQVDQPTDPRTDDRWASEATFATWSLDTNGDGTPDFEVQYFVHEGQFGGSVSRPGAADGGVVCDVSAADYGPEGYSVAFPSSCIGEPASFSYRVTMLYDTNPKDENADVASDVAPNGGMSFPVSRGS